MGSDCDRLDVVCLCGFLFGMVAAAVRRSRYSVKVDVAVHRAGRVWLAQVRPGEVVRAVLSRRSR